MRGGANGGRILRAQKSWDGQRPGQLATGDHHPGRHPGRFQPGERLEADSFADLIVLAGSVAVEEARQEGRPRGRVPFTPGRGDATQSRPMSSRSATRNRPVDGFRNFCDARGNALPGRVPAARQANLLGLTAPEMTVLVGGLRVLGANTGGSEARRPDRQPETLTNDFREPLSRRNGSRPTRTRPPSRPRRDGPAPG